MGQSNLARQTQPAGQKVTLNLVTPDGPAPFAPEKIDTFLPSWGTLRRAIHSLCKRSRTWNSIVAALEMRLNREELLSLPQYVALCPTGQCNALCEFCSVTKARSGIIKKQLPFDRLDHFIGPMAKTVRMYGIEGNGEPTLYDQFSDLVKVLTSGGASFYLITNGEKLTHDQVDLLLERKIDSVNFSLNAASAATHARVMKLKHFDVVISNVRRFLANRKTVCPPQISVSYVVTRDNVHELQEFMYLAEQDLGVDKLYVRPLSELGGEAGNREDGRALVPFESEIQDALDSLQEYLADFPRRSAMDIHPENFRNYRPDPPGRLIKPLGFEGRLLAPRRKHWTCNHASLQTTWSLNRLRLRCPSPAAAGVLMTSCPIPVEPGKELTFRCQARLQGSAVTIEALDDDDAVIAKHALAADQDNHFQEVSFSVQPGEREVVRLRIVGTGGALDAMIDFERLHTPGPGLQRHFKLPNRLRWQATLGGNFRWQDRRLALQWHGESDQCVLKSYNVACTPGQTHALAIKVHVKSGQLTLATKGGADNPRQTFVFPVGTHTPTLHIDTGEDTALQVTLSSSSTQPLDVDIDWQDTLAELPQHLSTVIDVPTQSNNLTAPSPERAAERPQGILQRALAPLQRLLGSEVKYYCQKPWTDLNNFTVDGRMDVCCIATGASQAKFALGNLFQQDFQQIWNGASMRSFRRTVNSDQPLPPCQRCPMAYAYQGPLFHAQQTLEYLHARVTRALPAFLAKMVRPVITWFNNHILFRGFKH